MTRKTRTTVGGSERPAKAEEAARDRPGAGPSVPPAGAKARRAAGRLQAVLELFTVFPAKD